MRKVLLFLPVLVAQIAFGQAVPQADVTTLAGRPWSNNGQADSVPIGQLSSLTYRNGQVYVYSPSGASQMYKLDLAARNLTTIATNINAYNSSSALFLDDTTLILNSPDGCFCVKSVNTRTGQVGTYLQFSGPGADKRPRAIDYDSAGNNIYGITDDGFFHKFSLVTGVDSVLPLNAPGFGNITAIAVDHDGHFVYLSSEQGRIMKYDVFSKLFTITSNLVTRGVGDMSIDPANTKLYMPNREQHALYLFDLTTNRQSILVGQPGQAGEVDGNGRAARLTNPFSMALSPDGRTIYLSDGSAGRVRKIVNDTVVSTIAGSPHLIDGPAASARFAGPYGLAVSDDGIVYVADVNNNAIRAIQNGIVSTVAGSINSSGSGTPGSNNGTLLNTLFDQPRDLLLKDSILFVSEFNNNGVRRLSLTNNKSTFINIPGRVQGLVTVGDTLFASCNQRLYKVSVRGGNPTVYAGTGTRGYVDGYADTAQLSDPAALVSDSSYIYIADRGSNRVRRINLATKIVSTVFFRGGDNNFTAEYIRSDALTANFGQPNIISRYKNNFFVANQSTPVVVHVELTGTNPVRLHAGDETHPGYKDTISTKAQFTRILGLSYASNRAYGVASDGNNVIRKLALRINSAPTLTAGGDVNFDPTAASTYSAAWGSAVSKGNSAYFNESAQRVTITLTNSDNSPFLQQPAIDSTGALAFTTRPTSFINDTVRCRLVLRDNGGSLFGGADSSVYTFRIILVGAVANKPVLTTNPLVVYPNPSAQEVAKIYGAFGKEVVLLDATGKAIRTFAPAEGDALPSLQAGLYFIRRIDAVQGMKVVVQ